MMSKAAASDTEAGLLKQDFWDHLGLTPWVRMHRTVVILRLPELVG